MDKNQLLSLYKCEGYNVLFYYSLTAKTSEKYTKHIIKFWSYFNS